MKAMIFVLLFISLSTVCALADVRVTSCCAHSDILFIDSYKIYDVKIRVDTTICYADLFPQLRTYPPLMEQVYDAEKHERKHSMSCTLNVLYVWSDDYVAMFSVTKYDRISREVYEAVPWEKDTLSQRIANAPSDNYCPYVKEYRYVVVEDGNYVIRYKLHHVYVCIKTGCSYRGMKTNIYEPMTRHFICTFEPIRYPYGSNFSEIEDVIASILEIRLMSKLYIQEDLLMHDATVISSVPHSFEEGEHLGLGHEEYVKEYVLPSSDILRSSLERILRIKDDKLFIKQPYKTLPMYHIDNMYIARSTDTSLSGQPECDITLRYMYIPYVMFMPLGIFDFEIESINGISYEKFMMNYNDMLKSR